MSEATGWYPQRARSSASRRKVEGTIRSLRSRYRTIGLSLFVQGRVYYLLKTPRIAAARIRRVPRS